MCIGGVDLRGFSVSVCSGGVDSRGFSVSLKRTVGQCLSAFCRAERFFKEASQRYQRVLQRDCHLAAATVWFHVGNKAVGYCVLISCGKHF